MVVVMADPQDAVVRHLEAQVVAARCRIRWASEKEGEKEEVLVVVEDGFEPQACVP